MKTKREQQSDVVAKLKAIEKRFTRWADANCTCGGGGPEEGCSACKAYHYIMDTGDGMKEDEG